MRPDDFRVLSQLGKALWSESRLTERSAIEALTAVSLLDLTPERALEKTTQAILEKANRDGPMVNQSSLDHPFYRLIPEERLILAALHIGRWSYKKLAEILELNEFQIATLAWNSRLRLASSSTSRKGQIYPVGNRTNGLSCPDYNPSSPWTQKFLDEEMTKREQIFVQNHLLVCKSCSRALNLSRELYYTVESMLPIPREGKEIEKITQNLNITWNKTYLLAHPSTLNVHETFKKFFKKPKILLPLMIVLILCFFFLK